MLKSSITLQETCCLSPGRSTRCYGPGHRPQTETPLTPTRRKAWFPRRSAERAASSYGFLTLGSKSRTLNGAKNGRSPCAYNMNAAPMSCATAGGSTPSNPSQTNPSMNWWMANSVGSAANSNSRRCVTLVNVRTPTAPNNPLPTKLAVAEKHTTPHLKCEHTANAISRIQPAGNAFMGHMIRSRI